MRRAAALAAAALAAGVLAACGDDEDGTPTSATSATSSSPAPAATTTDAGVATATAPPMTVPATPEEGGDEEGNVVPVDVDAGGAIGEVTAPAFLSLRIRATSPDRPRRIDVATRPPVTFTAPGERVVEGQQPGRYAIRVDGERAGTLVAE